MRKVLFLMLFCCMYVHNAYGKVCFLADPDCEIGALPPYSHVETDLCEYKSGFENWVKEEEKCKRRLYKEACKNENDGTIYYEDLGCDKENDYLAVEEISSDGVYIAYDVECGCAKVKCKKGFEKCLGQTTGVGEVCIEDGTEKYKICECNRDVYQYNDKNCTDIGYKLAGLHCRDDGGTYWSKCLPDSCQDWMASAKNTIADGEICDKIQQLTLADGSVTTCYADCYMPCEIDSIEDCEKKYPNFICDTDQNGCCIPGDCKDGYCKNSGYCHKYCGEEYKFKSGINYANAVGVDISSGKCNGPKEGDSTCNFQQTWYKKLKCKDGYAFDEAKGECVSTCTYKYDIAHYPNVKQTDLNDSCVRDGVTYYRDICDGVAESTCTGSQECFSVTCRAYNGNAYGTCTKGASCSRTDIQTSVIVHTVNAQAVYKNAIFSSTAELYKGSNLLNTTNFSFQFDAYGANIKQADAKVLGSVDAGTYIYKVGDYSFKSYDLSAGCAAGILGVVVAYPDYGSVCYANDDPSSVLGLLNISTCVSNKKTLPQDRKIEFEVRKGIVPTITAIYSANCFN